LASSACSLAGLPAGSVLHLRLDRPERRNALDGRLIDRLLAPLRGVRAGGPVRAVLLSGDGPAFCAGADLAWMRDGGRAAWSENLAGVRPLVDLLAALDACPVPTVARVHGAASGGGIGLLAAADVAVCAAGTRFAFSEVKLGLLPAVIAPYVVARIGEGQARSLFVTGQPFDAERALRIGLVHAVAAPQDLDGAVAAVLREVATAAPRAAVAARALLRRVRGREASAVRDLTATALATARAGPEGQAGLAAALARRAPPWALPVEPAEPAEA
jgi:methylglutaconyl-CoA hydratase